MAKFCDKCGTPLPEVSSFCLACGAPVVAQLPPAAAMPTAPAASYQPLQPASYQQPSPPYAPPPPVQAQPAWSAPPPPQQSQSQPAWSAPPPPPPPAWSQPAAPAFPSPAAQTPQVAQTTQVAQTARSSNTLLKVIVVILVVLGLGAVTVVGGLWYVGHRVMGKVKDAAAQAGISTEDIGHQGAALHGDPCRFLSKADVSAAIGVTITSTTSDATSCSYMARGTAADMTARHLTAMLGKRGVPDQQKQMIEKLAGGLFASQPTHEGETPADQVTDVPVLGVSFDTNSARTQMKLNDKVLTGLGSGSGSGDLSGIGDEAFVSADGMLMLRKGDTMVRIMYISCPCSTEQVKPLAKEVADAL